MNILILSWRGPGHPLAGGAEQVTLEHAKAWANYGHTVTLFTSRYPGSVATETISGVQIIRRGYDVFGVQIAAFFWYLFDSHMHIDLVVDEFHGIPFFTPLYVGGRKLGFIHELAKDVWATNPWPPPFNLIPWIVGKYGEPVVFRLFYRHIPFMTVSRSTMFDLVQLGVKSVTIVPNGLTSQEASPAMKKDKKFTLIYLSALSKDKGVEEAITVFNNLAHKDYQFWLVGKGEEKYSTLLKSKANPKINFFGYVSEEKKYELLSSAHVLLNPSIHEGWGLVNIEANACGTPVVGYAVSGMVDSVVNGKTGFLVPLHATNLLVQKILELQADKKLYKELQKNALAWAKLFSWRKSVDKSLKLISNL